MKTRTFKRNNGSEITVNDVDGLDELAKAKGWEEVKPKAKAKPKAKPVVETEE